MRMYVMCLRCGRSLAKVGPFCPACAREPLPVRPKRQEQRTEQRRR